MHFTRVPTALAAFIAPGNFVPTPATPECDLQSDNNLQLEIGLGTLTGSLNALAPLVRQFLGIPSSLPPTGARRWLPPSKYQINTSLTATSVGPACPQILVTDQTPLNNSVYAPGAGNQTEFFPLQGNFSEDCLTLNV